MAYFSPGWPLISYIDKMALTFCFFCLHLPGAGKTGFIGAACGSQGISH